MKTSLARCNECVVYHNWHRKGDWKKRFVKIVTGDFVVSKEENGLIFQSGWAEFARTYELVQGDILLFESSGSSCFEVRIFNQTGCEKELSCVAMKNTPCLNEKSMPHDNDMQSPRNERCGNMSGKRHAICKECAAFYYWHHMDKMRFFMVMMGVSASKNGLTIPKEFANNVRGKICDEIKLEVPDGQTHKVQVDKETNEVVLRSGWDAFVSAYELKEGDTLLFAYTGNSHFKVQIFNVSGCDKLLSCVVKNNPMQSPTESMKKLCIVCLECVDRHYWHMKDHDWCFVKVMSLSNFKDEMTIPDEFTTNFRGHISDKVKLEVADGNIYNVQVAKEQDKFILRSGWVDFTSAYEVKQYDSLFFIYSGDSHFKVRILKPSGCEKALSCVTMSCGPNVQERVICRALSLPSKKRCRNDSLTDNWKTTNVTPTDSPSQKSSSEMNTEDVTSSKDIPEPRSSGGFPGSTESRYILEKGCILTSAQKARVDTFVKESWTGIQFYVTAMNEKSLSDGCLVICKDYAAKHLPHQDQTIKLCYPQNSRTWDANLAVITDGACTRSCILAAGWLDFVRDNNLKEGDICAFEVSKGIDRVIITVHLLKNVVVTGHTKPTSQQQKEWTDPGYVVTRYTKLTCKQKRKVEERIQAIKPETRIFVSIIHSSRAKLSIEVRYATAHLPREEQWVRLQLPGKNHTWKSKLYIGDKDKGKCYALQTGWKKFVDDNKLQDDDICMFELLKNEELTMNVHIIRGD